MVKNYGPMEITSLPFEELSSWLLEAEEKPFRAKQIFEWLYQKKTLSFEKMTNLSLSLREKLAKDFVFPSLKLEKELFSLDFETRKYLFKLQDGAFIESVLIMAEGRRTVCLSTQVGCPMGCKFCASGKGFVRNLTLGEILEQALFVADSLAKQNLEITHVVFMGMGEPLLNYENTLRAIKILTSQTGFGISQRRISLSTVGVVDKISKLATEDLKINLVFSLHAPDQFLREKLIPSAAAYPLERILRELDLYFEKTGREITYEYVLLGGINDSLAHAKSLAKLLQARRGSVNLIPYNATENSPYAAPNSRNVEAFKEFLLSKGVVATQRYTKGADIAAACGQLAFAR